MKKTTPLVFALTIFLGLEASATFTNEARAAYTPEDPAAYVREFFGDAMDEPGFDMQQALVERFGDRVGSEPISGGRAGLAKWLVQMQAVETTPEPFAERDTFVIPEFGPKGQLQRAPLPGRPESLEGVDSIVVVFKEAAVTKKRNGKSALEENSFSSIGKLKKMHRSKRSSNKKGSSKKRSKEAIRLDNMYTAKLAKGNKLGKALAELNASPLVEYAEPDYPVTIFGAAPNDPYFFEVWGLNNTGQTFTDGSGNPVSGTAGADMNWLAAYTNDALFPTNMILVGVSDTGIDYNHEDIASQMYLNPGESGVLATNGIDDDNNGYVDDLYGADIVNGDPDPFDGHLHGTHVAGTILAATGNNKGLAGVNPYARLIAAKMFTDSAKTYGTSGIETIRYLAERGAKVINCSWGGSEYSQATRDACAYANQLGAMVVCAAGNANSPNAHYPSGYPETLSVAASDANDEKASFSNYGTSVDVMAPGHQIFSTLTSGTGTPGTPPYTNYLVISGTSMASPATAGLASLLMAKEPGHDPWLYQKVIEETCNTNVYSLPGNTNYVGWLGSGRIDTEATLEYMQTNAWLAGGVDLDYASGNIYMEPGASTSLWFKVGVWGGTMSNLWLSVTESESGISLNSTSQHIGVVDGFSVTNLETFFELSVSGNAEWGTIKRLDVELKQGETVLQSGQIGFMVMPLYIGNMVTYDIDADGRLDLISGFGGVITVFEQDLSVKWYNSTQLDGWQGISDLAVGDVDGDGMGEIVWTVSTLAGGDAGLFVMQEDGSMDTNEWPKSYSGVEDLALALGDLTGDGSDEILLARQGGSSSTLQCMNGEGNSLWSRGLSGKIGVPVIGDFYGTGTNLVAVNSGYDEKPVSTIRLYDGVGATINEIETRGVYDGINQFNNFGMAGSDLDADGRAELVLLGLSKHPDSGGNDGTLDRKCLLAYRMDGTQLDGFPIALEGAASGGYQHIALGDLDDDGRQEIMISGEGYTYSMAAYHSDGSPVDGFPVHHDVTLAGTDSPILADLTGDGVSEYVYAHDHHWSPSVPGEFRGTVQIEARDADHLSVHGYPMTVYHDYDSVVYHEFFVAPLFQSEFSTNATIIVGTGGAPHLYDTGVPFVKKGNPWPMPKHDAQRTSFSVRYPGRLVGNCLSTNRLGAGAQTVDFTSHIEGTNTSGLYYRWDFDGDGTWDAEGLGSNDVHYTYGEGNYTVIFSVSNSAGEVSSVTNVNYVQCHTPPTAEFSATPVSGIAAPVRVSFVDQSVGTVDSWSWNFGDPASSDNTSSEQNPGHLYTNAGTYTVSLIVSNVYGGGDLETKVSHITVDSGFSGPVTNFYVSLAGAHIYPFKTWAEAATNFTDAVEAMADYEFVEWQDDSHFVNGKIPVYRDEPSTVWITNGVYLLDRITRVSGSEVTIRSCNGPTATILDGQKGNHSIAIGSELQEDLPGDSIGIRGTTNALIEGITIQNVYAESQGAIDSGNPFKNTWNYNFLVRNCIINSNRCVAYTFNAGGGVSFEQETLGMEDCVVENNWAHAGGGVYSLGQRLSGTVIRGNRGTEGAGAWLSGTDGDDEAINNCLFYDNIGGESIVQLHDWDMFNCTLANNQLTGGNSAGALCWNESRRFINNVVYDNLEPDDGQQNLLFYNQGDETQNFSLDTGTEWRNNCISRDMDGEGQAVLSFSNITAHPLFLDQANDDFRLAAGSPCIDAGDNYPLYSMPLITGRVAKIDFGPLDNTTTGTGWNNMTDLAVGDSVSNLEDDDGNNTGWYFEISDSWESGYENPFVGAETNGVSVSGYPASATEDCLYAAGDDTVWFRIGGIRPDRYYQIRLVGGNSSEGTTIYMDFQKWCRDAKGNEKVSDAILESTGEIQGYISPSSIQIGHRARVASLVIEELTPTPSYPSPTGVDVAGNPRLVGAAPDIGAFETDGDYEPVSGFTATPNPVSSGTAVSFVSTAVDYDGTLTNFVWDFGDGTVTNGASLTNVTHTYDTSGLPEVYQASMLYAARLTVTDNSGQTDTVEERITVQPALPPVPEDFRGTNDSPLVNTLYWTDVDVESGYQIARGDVLSENIEVIVDQDDFNTPADGVWPAHEGYDLENGFVMLSYAGSKYHTYGYHRWYPGTGNLHTAWGTLYGPTDFTQFDWATEKWVTNTVPSYGYRHDTGYDSTDNSNAEFHPELPEEGWYEIYEWHPQHEFNSQWDGTGLDKDYRSAIVSEAVRHLIHAAEGNHVVWVNQQENCGQWNSLGLFHMRNGDFVEISGEESQGDVILADAIRFVKRAAPNLIGSAPQDAESYTDSAAYDDVTFTYYLRATNSFGASPWTECAVRVPTTNSLPGVSIDFVSTTSGVPSLFVQATGSASDAEKGVAQYEWDFGDGFVGSIQRGAELTNTSYSYKYDGVYNLTLTATDEDGFSASTSVVITVDELPPAAPTGLAAVQFGDAAIRLFWSDQSYNEDQFIIQRKVSSGAYQQIGAIGAGYTAYTDSSVEQGNVYTYRVAATNDQGLSDWSNEVEASLESADYSLPFSEPFEALTAGTLDGQHGWTGGGVVQTNVSIDAQALALTDEEASHLFVGSPTNIWIEFAIQGIPSEAPPESIDPNAVAVFYISTNNQIVAYSNQTPVELSAEVSNGWNNVEIFCDYVSKVWKLSLNEIDVATNLGFYSDQAAFSSIVFAEQSTNTTYLDDIGITADPFDADGDGLPDEWEEFYFSGDVNPSALSSNGVNTLIEAYIAGLDPTDPSDYFLISDFWPLTSVLQWNATSGRVYTIYWTSNLLSSFQSLETNFTGGAFTDLTHGVDGQGFYKIDVQMK